MCGRIRDRMTSRSHEPQALGWVTLFETAIDTSRSLVALASRSLLTLTDINSYQWEEGQARVCCISGRSLLTLASRSLLTLVGLF